jgi:hypothetical protein
VSKPRVSKSPKARAPAHAPEEEFDVDLDETTPTDLDRHDLTFLRRVHTFLFHIHRFPHQAKRQAYTQKEHDLGWELWSVASGRNRPFDHWLAESDQKDHPADISSERLRILKEIDAFENLWFPRMRALIARVIPKKNADRFAAGFFKDLSQQPLGPAVVDSVKTFLNRVEELKKSREPGAFELHTTLHQRGLTPEKIEAMRRRIAAAEAHKKPAGGAPKVSRAEIAKAKKAQLAAFESLKLWYNDWATTFRGALGVQAQIVLGLTTFKRKQPTDDTEGDAPKGGADDEPEGEIDDA